MNLRRNQNSTVGPHGIRRANSTPEVQMSRMEILLLLGLGIFVVAGVIGYAWALDRQLRGGLLQQHSEAAARPDWVEVAQLPGYVPQAFLIVVDPDFDAREGFSVETERTTMSRDLVRQVHLLAGSVDGRARELLMAPLLERHLPRDQMLELYLNRVYLGRETDWPIYGVSSAAREYFHKAATELTLGEAATLAGLLLPPRIDRPGSVPGAVGIRRLELLREMLRLGYITPEQYQSALAEPLGFQPGISDPPMTRPLRWRPESPVLRLPEDRRPQPDTVEAQLPA